jgi:RHS repeat-associated protein
MLIIRDEQMQLLSGARLGGARMDAFRRERFLELRDLGFQVKEGPNPGEFLIADNAGGTARVLSRGPKCSVTTGEGRTFVTEQYDLGRIRSVTDPAGNRVYFERDEDGVLKRLDTGNGQIHNFSIDKSWTLHAIEYPDGTATRSEHDSLGRLVAVWDRNDGVTRYGYTPDGLLESMTDANGNQTSFLYDERDLPSAIVYANGNRHEFRYSDEGLLEQMIVNGQPFAQFDQNAQAGRHVIQYNDGAAVRYQLKDGRIVEAGNESATVRFEYDAHGLPTAEETDGQKVQYLRNGTGALMGIVTPEGEKITFTRDTDQRLTSITGWAKGRYVLENPAAGPPTRIEYPNGVVDSRTITPMGLVEDLTLISPKSQGRPIESLRFHYDLCNRMIQTIRDGETRRCLYDKAGRLVGVESSRAQTSESFQLDPRGNLLRHGAAETEYDVVDQIVQHDNRPFTYDLMGNMISGVCPAGPVEYTYNGGGQLIAAKTPAGVARYFYDAVGRRIRKEVGGRSTCYVWAGTRLLSETTTEGPSVIKRDYLWDPDRPVLYAMRENGKIYYLHTGARCEILCMTDETGSVVWRAGYSAFGRTNVIVNKVSQPWRLAGQYFDEETGLCYVLARYYDPALGRFLSVDPVMAGGGSRNPYLYCDGDPINSLDSTGTIGAFLTGVLVGAAVGAAIGAVAGAGIEMYRQRNQEHFEWGKIGKAALIGGVVGAIGGAVGAAVEGVALAAAGVGAAATAGGAAGGAAAGAGGAALAVVGAGALAGAASSAVEYCAEVALTDTKWSWADFGKSVGIGAGIGAVTAGVGGMLAARAARKAAQAAERNAVRELAKSPGAVAKCVRRPILGETKRFLKKAKDFVKCKILRAEPVNILTGDVFLDQSDFTLPGRIPIEWTRTYSSGSKSKGCCGLGWETPADIRIEVDSSSGVVEMVRPSEGPLLFDRLPVAQGEAAAELELMDGALLSDNGRELIVRTKEGSVYRFGKHPFRVNADRGTQYPITRIEDLCGNWLEFERRDGRLIGIRESAGRRFELTYADDLITEVALYAQDTNERHVFVRYRYGEAGDLETVLDAFNKPYAFAYDAHHMVRQTDRNGLSFYYEYEKTDEGGRRVIHAWGDDGLYDYRFQYLDPSNERRITDSLGNVSIIKLNERGLPISEIDPLGGTTNYEYDEVGRTTAIIDQNGLRIGFEYDERGNLLKLTRPDGKSIVAEYNHSDKAVRITDPDGATWQQVLDERGLLIGQRTPLGAESSYEYDDLGQLISFTNPLGAKTELSFDGIGNLTGLKDALGHRTRFDYELLGNVTAKIDPMGQKTSYDYDSKGRMVNAVLPSGASIACGYDPEDNLVSYVDENGHETHLEYFGLGEIAKRIQPDGYSVQYHYDSEEQLIGVTNQRGETYHLKRDPLGRIVEEVDYWGQVWRYTYDACGRIASSTDPLGRTINYITDPLGRILQKILPNGFVENFTYDANGNIVETRNPHITVTRKFDREGSLIDETQGEFSIKSAYDANGNRSTRETSFGNTVAYEFDALDQVVSVRINQDAPILIKRDAAGRIAEEKLGGHVLRRLRYSADGYLTEQASLANGSPLYTTRFEYDKTGNLTRRSDSQFGADAYRYDPLGRITEHLDPQGRLHRYLNDPAGDRLGTRIGQGAKQGIESEETGEWRREGECEGVYYQFDRAGNLVERRDDQRGLLLVWDANQRLVESHSNGTITRYGYDPLGRRLFKETKDRRTLFFWDDDALVGESVVILNMAKAAPEIEDNAIRNVSQRQNAQLTSPQKAREYLYYPETFDPLALMEGRANAQQVYHYHNDPNGCPTRLTDAGGQVKWAAMYSAWGHATKSHVSTVDNPIRLQGQYEDVESGLHYNRFRYYDSNIGSFISQDPIGLAGSNNLYAYGKNSLHVIDPLGLMPWAEPTDVGHHLVPQSLARSTGTGPVARLLGTNTQTPTFFFKKPYRAGAHEAIHAAQRPHVGRLQGAWKGTPKKLLEASREGLVGLKMRGHLKIPATGEIIARNVTPVEAFNALMEWFAKKKKCR